MIISLIETMSAADHLVFLIGCIVALTSALFYRSDKDPAYFTGKSERIHRNPMVEKSITLMFYGLFAIIATHSLFDISEPVRLWESETSKILGSLLALTGTGLFVWAKVLLGTSYSPCFNSFVPNALVDQGIYAFIRHPIYLANLIIFAGATMATGSLLAIGFLLILGYFYRQSVLLEEQKLSEALEGYQEYMNRTSAIFPKLRLLS